MTDRILRVLMVEDNGGDAELIEHALRRAEIEAVLRRCTTADGFAGALREFAPHVVLCDHAMSQFNAMAALELLRAAAPATPMIVVSGALDEHMAVQCVRAGVEDLVSKQHLDGLGPAIERALASRERIAALSPRQMQVLCLVAQGLTTRRIAETLKISDKTVETHRGEIMKRTGIHDVVSLVRYAIRLGLVPAVS